MILQWRDDNDNKIRLLSPHNLNYHCPMHDKAFEKIDQSFDSLQYICNAYKNPKFFMRVKMRKFPHTQYLIGEALLGCKPCLNNAISWFEEQQRNFAHQPAIEMTLNEHGAGRCPGVMCHLGL